MGIRRKIEIRDTIGDEEETTFSLFSLLPPSPQFRIFPSLSLSVSFCPSTKPIHRVLSIYVHIYTRHTHTRAHTHTHTHYSRSLDNFLDEILQVNSRFSMVRILDRFRFLALHPRNIRPTRLNLQSVVTCNNVTLYSKTNSNSYPINRFFRRIN